MTADELPVMFLGDSIRVARSVLTEGETYRREKRDKPGDQKVRSSDVHSSASGQKPSQARPK